MDRQATDTWTDKQQTHIMLLKVDKKTDQQTDKETGRQTNIQTNRETDRKPAAESHVKYREGQTDKQTPIPKQTDKQKHKQTN